MAESSWPGKSPACWDEPRLVHIQEAWGMIQKNISFDEIKIPAKNQKSTISPNGSYFFNYEGARPTATIQIYAEKDKGEKIHIREVFGLTDIRWATEKLIYFRVWWGRIAADDIFYDVENKSIVYSEPLMDGSMAYNDFKEMCKKTKNCECGK